MKTTITLDRNHLWQMIQAMSLNADNKMWLGEKLINEARKEKEEKEEKTSAAKEKEEKTSAANPPCQFSAEEAKQILEESELCFAQGKYISEEEMDKYLQTLA